MQKIEKVNLKFKHFLISGIIIATLFVILIVSSCRTQKINFEDKQITTYDDRLESNSKGNSEILSLNKCSTGLQLSYILKPGFAFPYAGIAIPLKDSDGKFLDCTRFDKLNIRIASKRLFDCKLYLKVFDPAVSQIDNPLSERYLKRDLILDSVPVTISIPLKQFIEPEWWYQKNNLSLKDVAPADLSKVTSLQIESGSTAETGVIDTITISQIYLTKSANIFTILAAAFISILIIVFILIKTVSSSKTRSIIITYDKKDISNYRDIDAQRISAYIAENFSDPQLSILNMGETLGMSQKKIAKIMNDVFKMSFKQYLTSIRIHEAKRLLQETDRLVIDIAMTVGFNSISHFNRVFKATTKINPMEFRKKGSLK
jgi:AraC-like DNA-binding protein/uncharacterized integral membrane protein